MTFESIQNGIKMFEPALLLDSVISHRLRRRIEAVLRTIVLIIFVAVILQILSLYGAERFGENSFTPFLREWAEELYGLFSVSLSLYLVGAFVNAFYYSFYFKSCPACLMPERVLGGLVQPKLTYEAAELFYESDAKDMVRSLIGSKHGFMVMARLGISGEETAAFLAGRKAMLPAGVCDFEPTGEFGMLTVADVGKTVIERDEELMFFLSSRGLSKDSFLGALQWMARLERSYKRELRWWSREKLGRIPSIGKDWSYGGAYKLKRHAREITGAGSGTFAGRSSYVSDDVEVLEGILARRREANALIVGEDGGAKEEIIYELARRIGEGRVLPEIEGKRIFLFDGSSYVAGMKDKQEFESSFIEMISEAASAGDIMLVITDFPAFQRSAERTLSNVLSLLEPFLDSPEMHIIALSTPEAFHSSLEQDEKARRFFERIIVEERSSNLYLQLVQDESLKVEYQERVFFTYPAIQAIVDGATRYFPGSAMPDKAIDLLYEIGPHIRSLGKKVVLKEDVLKLIESRTGIPSGEIRKDEKELLLTLEEKLHRRVVGQEDAISAISGALRRARSGIGNPEKPLGSFLFLGPTGVGKTETVKALADIFFKDANAVIRIDMSEFRTNDSLERLIGYFEGGTPGILASKLRERPYGVLLLDEFEKTSQSVLDLFLQVLDEGVFSDMAGKKVSAKNLIIVATSNAGSDIIWNSLGPGKEGSLDKQTLIQEIVNRAIFKPELLNRFDGVIVFHPLQDSHLAQIARLMLKKLEKRLKEKGIQFEITDELVDFLVREGSDPAFGARPMNRAIQEKVEQLIAEKMIRGDIIPGSKISLSHEDFEKM